MVKQTKAKIKHHTVETAEGNMEVKIFIPPIAKDDKNTGEAPGMWCCWPRKPSTTLEEANRWYLFTVISSFVSCFPCNVLGLIYAVMARDAAEKGNLISHGKLRARSQLWTKFSILLAGIGVCIIGILIILRYPVGFYSFNISGYQIGIIPMDDNDYPVDRMTINLIDQESTFDMFTDEMKIGSTIPQDVNPKTTQAPKSLSTLLSLPVNSKENSTKGAELMETDAAGSDWSGDGLTDVEPDGSGGSGDEMADVEVTGSGWSGDGLLDMEKESSKTLIKAALWERKGKLPMRIQ